jgi:FAD/FMN-containing dehydrogenase
VAGPEYLTKESDLISDKIHWRGDDGYEPARLGAVWNELKPDRYPAGIVMAQTEQDVVDAVRLARERGLRVKAKSGGHGWTGSSVRDGALLVDVKALDEITVDPAARTATAGPGTTGPPLNAALELHGLIFPTGHCETVTLGGYLIQGGWGWNSGKFGPACQSVIGVDVVTADGELVHADKDTHPDLLWAARGSGPGFFGIITRFYLQAHPRPKSMMTSDFIYPLEVIDEILPWAVAVRPTIAPELEMWVMSMTPRVDWKVVDGPCRLVVAATAMCDTDEESIDALRVLETCPALDHAVSSNLYTPVTMDVLYKNGSSGEAAGFRWSPDSMWTDAGADELIPAVREMFLTVPTPASHVSWLNWPRPDMSDSALSITGDVYISAWTGWTDPADDERYRYWGRDHMRRLAPLSNGIQLADENLDARPEARYLSDDARERVELLREQWDPDRVFLSYLAGNG